MIGMLAAPLTGMVQAEQPKGPLVTSDPQPRTNAYWWPDRLDLSVLREHDVEANPYGASFNYAQEFKSLDLAAVKHDINTALTTSQDWWPADYGNYGPFFIRMAWHSAGTYRIADGRGGSDGAQQRFEPLNSWPDNANLDKARRLLWPIKQKYGSKLSWGDLMVLTGNVALENMGFKTLGYAGGRADDWQPDLVYWGDGAVWMSDNTGPDGKIKKPLGASQMGLIYVNPEGPMRNHDPVSAAAAIRNAFGNMAMNDEETVALIAGGHTFGKAHGAHDPSKCVGVVPAAGKIEAQGLGWKNTCGKGNAEDTTTSGLEGAWSSSPTYFTMMYINNLLDIKWEKTKSPAGATQWTPTNASAMQIVPDAHIPGKMHAPIMFTTDIALTMDPSYNSILKRFQKNPEEFKHAFAAAWFKLTHRDMGPRWRYLGADVPQEAFIWQDPLPTANYTQIDDNDVATLKLDILHSGLSIPQLVRTAWASAASFRGTDWRGGANGARIALEPEKHWAVNNPKELNTVLNRLAQVREQFNSSLHDGKRVSMADVIVLAGDTAIEAAAVQGGYKDIYVPFTPGRVDASQAQTDTQSFAVLEPTADAFRNYYSSRSQHSPTNALVDKASTLNLTVPEMTVLLGGLRSLNMNADDSLNGVLTKHPGVLSNDFFVNLLDMSTVWKPAAHSTMLYDGFDRKTGHKRWTATPVDLIFGSNSELRAVTEVYASDDAKDKFAQDFVAAWAKVMSLDLPPSAK